MLLRLSAVHRSCGDRIPRRLAALHARGFIPRSCGGS
ncbi:hypothetical protein HAL1_20320, partial [Halomonas sp. HAL1]